jgi:hypothetical protein
MGFVLTAIGLLFLIVCLAGVALGLYMAADPKTRGGGWRFAVWWVPGVAAASGVLMRDVVTFTVGALCFLVAGAVFVLGGDRSRKPPAARKGDLTGGPGRERPLDTDSEKITNENRAQSSGRVAS